MSVEFESTSIYLELRKILRSEEKPVRYAYSAIIHTEQEDFKTMKLLSLDIIRDYKANIGDQIHLELVMPFGDYVKRFYPYRDNLEVTIVRQKLLEVGEADDEEVPPEKERYKCVFIPDENKQIATSEYSAIDKFTLDLIDVLTVKLQLLDRAIEPLRIKTTGGIYKNISHGKLIFGLLAGESNKVIVDGKKAIDGFDVVKPQNETVHNHVIIPHGTLITALPSFFQEHMNGVYASANGTYLQKYKDKRMWFIYPLYNPNRFDENVPKIIFYSVPRNKFPSIERTYRVEGDVVYAAITAGKSYKDSAETDFMNDGVGFRLTDARTIMDKPVAIGSDGPVGSRKAINFEVAIKDRKDGLNYAPVADRDISSNPFAQYSRVAERAGGRVDIVWENAKPELIYPGMPCKYVFVRNDDVKEQRGIILFNHCFTQVDTPGMAGKSYSTTCQITIFVEGIKPEDF